MTTHIAVCLPEGLIEQLDALVPVTHGSRSEAIRRSIELYLYRLESERDAQRNEREPLSDAGLSVADDEDTWSDPLQWQGARSGGRQRLAATGRCSC